MFKITRKVILLSFVLFFSCENSHENTTETPIVTQTKIDPMYEELYLNSHKLAKRLAVDMRADPALQEEILLKIGLQIDGDTELFLELLERTTKERYVSELEVLNSKYLLELRMPTAKLWSMEQIRNAGGIRVLVAPFGQDDKSITFLEGYDGTGAPFTLKKEEYKSVPYLILVDNERTTESGQLRYGEFKNYLVQNLSIQKSRNKKFTETNLPIKQLKDVGMYSVKAPMALAPPIEDPWEGGGGSGGGSSSGGSTNNHISVVNYADGTAGFGINGTDTKFIGINRTSNNQGFRISKMYFPSEWTDDGWFDCDVEVSIRFFQAAFNLNIDANVNIANLLTLPAGSSINMGANDILNWYKEFDTSYGDWFYPDKIQYFNDLYVKPIPALSGFSYYNSVLHIHAWEIDSGADDKIFITEIPDIKSYVDRVSKMTYSSSWKNGSDTFGYDIRLFFDKINY